MERGRKKVRKGHPNPIARALLSLLRDERGQATIEYILLLSFIGVFSGFFGRRLLKIFNDSILKFNGAFERDLKTGRTPLYVWRN